MKYINSLTFLFNCYYLLIKTDINYLFLILQEGYCEAYRMNRKSGNVTLLLEMKMCIFNELLILFNSLCVAKLFFLKIITTNAVDMLSNIYLTRLSSILKIQFMKF